MPAEEFERLTGRAKQPRSLTKFFAESRLVQAINPKVENEYTCESTAGNSCSRSPRVYSPRRFSPEFPVRGAPTRVRIGGLSRPLQKLAVRNTPTEIFGIGTAPCNQQCTGNRSGGNTDEVKWFLTRKSKNWVLEDRGRWQMEPKRVFRS